MLVVKKDKLIEAEYNKENDKVENTDKNSIKKLQLGTIEEKEHIK